MTTSLLIFLALICIVLLIVYKNNQGLGKLKKENERLTDLVESVAKRYSGERNINVPGVSELELKKQKIMHYLDNHEMVTNDDVEKICSVSDSTATNYLQLLEDEGKIVQIGGKGRYVYYVKNKMLKY